jgi:hypothetical protein
MSQSVSDPNLQPTIAGDVMGAPSAAQAAAFQSMAAANPTAPLLVSGNSVDTGRYIITASTSYTRPSSFGGGQANDGMLTVYDTQTGTSVEVFGDPHVATSAGDEANFQADGLTLNLADGTQIQFDPTAETNGVSHIGQVAITEGGETVVQSGFDTGAITTSGIQKGGPSTADGFNNVHDTVLSSASDGSLGTLTNTWGAQLNSIGYSDSLDGMGGGYTAFALNSSTTAMQSYSSALDEMTSAGNGPQAADEPKQGASTIPAAAKPTAATS